MSDDQKYDLSGAREYLGRNSILSHEHQVEATLELADLVATLLREMEAYGFFPILSARTKWMRTLQRSGSAVLGTLQARAIYEVGIHFPLEVVVAADGDSRSRLVVTWDPAAKRLVTLEDPPPGGDRATPAEAIAGAIVAAMRDLENQPS